MDKVWASPLASSSAVVAVKTYGHASAEPPSNRLQALMSVPLLLAKQSSNATELIDRTSNMMSSEENWNLTVRVNATAATVTVFSPTTRSWALPKKSLPLAVVLYTRYWAPPVGKEVTLMDRV